METTCEKGFKMVKKGRKREGERGGTQKLKKGVKKKKVKMGYMRGEWECKHGGKG